MKRLLLRLALALVAALALAFLARNFIARKSVEVGVRAVTGFPLEIAAVNIHPSLGRLDVQGLHLKNPRGFAEETFVQLPSVSIDYKVGSMLARAPHIHEMTIDIAQLNVIKQADGVSNVAQLKGVDAKDQPAAESRPLKYQIDVLRVHFGTVTVTDHTKSPASVRTYALNLDATYHNISDPSDITRLVLITVMSKVGLPNIGVDVTGLTKGLGPVTDAAGGAITSGAEALGKTGRGLLDKFKRPAPAGE